MGFFLTFLAPAYSPQTVHTPLEISCNCSEMVRHPYFINVSKHRLESATGPLRQSHMPLLQKTPCGRKISSLQNYQNQLKLWWLKSNGFSAFWHRHVAPTWCHRSVRPPHDLLHAGNVLRRWALGIQRNAETRKVRAAPTKTGEFTQVL